jgi:alpha-galactosidase
MKGKGRLAAALGFALFGLTGCGFFHWLASPYSSEPVEPLPPPEAPTPPPPEQAPTPPLIPPPPVAPVAVAAQPPPPPPPPASLTPPPPDAPRINGPKVFGVRPGSPFFYVIPATGRRPMSFAAAPLPAGLQLDPATGRLTGSVSKVGEYNIVLRARNDFGQTRSPFRIVVGERIALTPPMGWNSWNCWAGSVDQEKMLRSARALAASGLAEHGWVYVNIDDSWQGKRAGPLHAIQPNARFPDIKALCDEIHALGLKAGIYSTPWTTSYACYVGGSSNNPDGSWSRPVISKEEKRRIVNKNIMPWAIGRYHFMDADAKQWAQWGFDYLKYDWNPIEPPDVEEMSLALRYCGRDIVYSLSNSAPFEHAADYARLANCWRTSGDIRDTWASMTHNGFNEDPWMPYADPGHWNDPDMLVVGQVGWGHPHASRLTPDEQYTHISLWCLLSAPLLLGCDMEKLDPFTIGLLTNDEVLALDQDELGEQATRVAERGSIDTYAKPLADGSWAVGLFNRGETPIVATVAWSELGLSGSRAVRDLWRQRDVGVFPQRFSAEVAPHGVALIQLTPPAK